MTPQTTFADGTQTLFIGQAVFTPFRQKYDKTANERAVIYQALKQHEMRTVEGRKLANGHVAAIYRMKS